MRKMLFTIAIPTYRRNDLLCKAISSAIKQNTNVNYEVLVVDNDPDSNFENFIPQYINQANCQIRYIKNELNIGMFGNWNKCIEHARGKWITILSDDDMLHEKYIDAIEKYFDTRASCIAVGKKDFQIDIDTVPICEPRSSCRARTINKRIFNIFNPVGTPTGFAFRRDLALKIGGYDPNYYPSSDYLFAKKLVQHGSFIKIKEVYGFTGIGVNESININTLKLFYSQDLNIRNIRPRFINNIIGVLNIVEQSRKFNIKQSALFGTKRVFDTPMQLLGSAFRLIKTIIFNLNSKRCG